MKDVAYDKVAEFQASDVLSTDYNYINGEEVVTHTNEAYITSTGGMKMSENEAYRHTTFPGETCTSEGEEHNYCTVIA